MPPIGPPLQPTGAFCLVQELGPAVEKIHEIKSLVNWDLLNWASTVFVSYYSWMNWSSFQLLDVRQGRFINYSPVKKKSLLKRFSLTNPLLCQVSCGPLAPLNEWPPVNTSAAMTTVFKPARVRPAWQTVMHLSLSLTLRCVKPRQEAQTRARRRHPGILWCQVLPYRVVYIRTSKGM